MVAYVTGSCFLWVQHTLEDKYVTKFHTVQMTGMQAVAVSGLLLKANIDCKL